MRGRRCGWRTSVFRVRRGDAGSHKRGERDCSASQSIDWAVQRAGLDAAGQASHCRCNPLVHPVGQTSQCVANRATIGVALGPRALGTGASGNTLRAPFARTTQHTRVIVSQKQQMQRFASYLNASGLRQSGRGRPIRRLEPELRDECMDRSGDSPMAVPFVCPESDNPRQRSLARRRRTGMTSSWGAAGSLRLRSRNDS